MRKLLLILFISISYSGFLKSQNLSDNYQYEIELIYDSLYRQFSGDLTMTFNQPLNSLLELPFNFLIDSTNEHTIKVWINGRDCEYEIANKVTNEFTGIIIKTQPDLLRDNRTSLNIKFKSVKHGDYFNKNQILYNGSWMPMLQYYENGGFKNYNQKHSDYKINISYPDDFVIATSGTVLKETKQENQILIQTEAKDIPSYGLVLSRDFLVSEVKTKNGILIRSLYNVNDIKWGKKLLDIAEDVIDFYIDTIDFYPQPVLTIIPGADKPYGGWPVSPNIICVHRGIDTKGDYANTHATWITAHEIGHQYWGYNYVLEPLDYPQWFGISMGIYTDWLYSHSRHVDRNYFGFFNSYIKGFNKGYNTTVLQLTDSLNQQNFDWNNVILHGKSFTVLRILAYEIGDDNFFKVYNYCLDNYKGINVTLEMFQQTCEKISGLDLNWFFEQWYKTNKYLDYEILGTNSRLENQNYVTQCKSLRKGDAVVSSIEIGFKQNNGDILIKSINGKIFENDIIVETKFPIECIIIDPNKMYPLINREEYSITN